MNEPTLPDLVERKRRARRNAIVLALVALAVYVLFVVLTVTKQ